jgi:hypothetical protein
MSKVYGLPTFPIADGMSLDTREPDELQWLIDRGNFERHDTGRIQKVSEDLYQYLRVKWYRNAPNGLELEEEAASLQELLKLLNDKMRGKVKGKITHIRYWKWWANGEEPL